MVNPGANAVETDHAGSTIAWREAGRGNPVVFLHGLGGSREAWGPQLRGLSDQFRCIAWDMPGYGDSAPLIPLTYRAIADRLVGLLDELQIERADLVGLSFGGMHALHTAIHHPDRVGRLVLADTSPAFGMDGTTVAEWTSARLAPIEAGATPADLAGPVIDAITAVTLSGQVRTETLAAFARIPTEGFTAAVRCLPTNDVRDQLAVISHPALVVVGELDTETPPAYAKTLADGLPNSELHVLPGVGHLSPAEAPDAFNELVASFLSTDQPARTSR
jgi:3-oxoadipate enol-lactonase